jgi:acid phosphatase (class A)
MNHLTKAVRSTFFLWVILPFLLCAAEKPYIALGEIDLTKLLAPPPPQNSEQTKKELEEILQWQKMRTKVQIDSAIADQEADVFLFANVLGEKFNKKNLPMTTAFFQKAVENAKGILDPSKDFWNRPRPYIFDSLVHPCVDKPKNSSYPSGHSTIGNLFAILLANMVPEKNSEIFQRGWKFALNRVIGGVHYRSDIEGGRIAATVIAAALFKSNDFKTDFEKAKTELRKALGIAAISK